MVWRLMMATAFVGALALAYTAQAQPGPQRSQASLGILVDPATTGTQGVVVRSVSRSGPAGKAGIQKGDVITHIGKQAVENYNQLEQILAQHKPGDKVPVTVMRNDKKQELHVTLGERGAMAGGEQGLPSEQGGPSEGSNARQSAYIGVEAEPLTPERAQQLGIQAEHGAYVRNVMPNSPAATAKLQTGDVITQIDGKPVEDINPLRTAVEQAGVGKTITLTVLRDGKSRQVKVRLKRAPANFSNAQPFGGFPGGFGNFGPGGFGNFGPGFGGNMPFGGQGGLGGPAFGGEQQRIQQLERRVRQLERRLNELEKRQG